MPMLQNGLQVDRIVYTNDVWRLVCSRMSSSCILKCKHTTLAISVLNDIFPLHTKMQYCHLEYPKVLH
jgi:hypothetical protein